MQGDQMTAADRKAAVSEFIRTRLSARTEVPLDKIDASSVLIDLGLRSIDAVLLCGEVEDSFQVELDPSTIFEHETLGDFIAAVLASFQDR
jgi:acyl carrier protein